ncbi:MAG TPA: putative quinol monooxygenase, partial [Bacteroidales bacterium]|nr:putative quinol monooxygenase [Bacteroidales bacterium]
MKTRLFTLILLISMVAISCNQNTSSEQNKPEAAVVKTDNQRIIEAKIFVKPGSEAEFIEAAKYIIEKTNNEEGCIFYQLYQDPYIKTNFIMVEKYKNQAAVEFHFAQDYF